MNITLKVTPEVLKAKASQVENDIKTLEMHFNGIQDIMAKTCGYWVGAAGDKARTEFNNQKECADRIVKRFREHPVELLIMAGIYEEKERALTSENQRLATDVIA